MSTPTEKSDGQAGIPVHARLWPADRDRLAYVAQYLQDTGILAGPVTMSAAIRYAIMVASCEAREYYDEKTAANDGP